MVQSSQADDYGIAVVQLMAQAFTTKRQNMRIMQQPCLSCKARLHKSDQHVIEKKGWEGYYPRICLDTVVSHWIQGCIIHFQALGRKWSIGQTWARRTASGPPPLHRTSMSACLSNPDSHSRQRDDLHDIRFGMRTAGTIDRSLFDLGEDNLHA